jgi:hemolysin activation/secretion protein
MDDIFAIIYQAPWDSEFTEQWSLFGSYDFPIMGPKLRLNVYAGYSQFDINPDSGNVNFLGNGHFYGGTLRYNLFQTDQDSIIGNDWFFDVKGMVEYVRSKTTPSLLPNLANPPVKSDPRFWMWGIGAELHRRTDMSNSSISIDRWQRFGDDSDKQEFFNARQNSDYYFHIWDLTAYHNQYIDPNKVHRISSSIRWVEPSGRLVPAKMTSFGGMYTVRGYDEYEIIADGGLLASLQYEYDLIAANKAAMPAAEQQEKDPFEIKKAAPLIFTDYGRARNEGPLTAGEQESVDLWSVGIGALLDVGDHFSGAVYYGYPMKGTDDTKEGKGRVNVSFMLRW